MKGYVVPYGLDGISADQGAYLQATPLLQNPLAAYFNPSIAHQY